MTIISHLKLMVPVIEKPPPELMDTFIKGCLRAAPKTYRHLKKALPDTKAVIDKMIKPGLKATESFFNPEYGTRRGMKIKDIPAPSQDDIETWARRWLKGTQYAFEKDPKERIREIKFKAENYIRETAYSNLPFSGFGDKIRGVGPVGARWLTGDKSVLSLIGPGDTFKAPPVNIIPTSRRDQAARFRGRFINQIVSAGSKIIKADYRPSLLAKGNDKINRLVSEYARDKFVPFTPGGASHVDFIREPAYLFLDIQVSTR